MRSLQQWLAYQQGTHPRAIDLSLERVREVAARLGCSNGAARSPSSAAPTARARPPRCWRQLLQAHGQRVGLFTSPHLLRYNERVQIDGAPASDATLVAAFERIEAARGAITLTFFEYNTLAALIAFREAQVEAMVLEVGLGGRLDATNILDADVAVLCSVGLDHRDWLGDTLEQIGAEKAGIFRARPAGRARQCRRCPRACGGGCASSSAACFTAEREFQLAHRRRGLRGGALGLPFSALQPRGSYRRPALRGSDPIPQCRHGTHRAAAAGRPRAPAIARASAAALRSVRLAGPISDRPGRGRVGSGCGAQRAGGAVLAQELAARPTRGRTLAVVGMLADKDAAGDRARTRCAHRSLAAGRHRG